MPDVNIAITRLEKAPDQGTEFELPPESHLIVVPELNDFPESAIAGMAAFLTRRYFWEKSLIMPAMGQRNFSNEVEFREKVNFFTGGEISYVTEAFTKYMFESREVRRSAVDIDVLDANQGLDLPINIVRLESPKHKPPITNSPSLKEYSLENGVLMTAYNRAGLEDDPENPDMSRLETAFTIYDHADRPLFGYIFEADIS